MAEQQRMPDNSVNNSIADYIEAMSLDTEGTLKSIDLTLRSIAKSDGLLISQSSLKDLAEQERLSERSDARRPGGRYSNDSQRNQGGPRGQNAYMRGQDPWSNTTKRDAKLTTDKISNDFEKAFKEALFGTRNPFKDVLNKSVSEFARSLGTDVKGLSGELGKRLGTMIKDSSLGKPLKDTMDYFQTKAASILNSSLSQASRAMGGTGDVDLKNTFSQSTAQDLKDAVDSSTAEAYTNMQASQQNFQNDMNVGFDNVDIRLQELIAAARQRAMSTNQSDTDITDLVDNVVDVPIPELPATSGAGELTDVVDSLLGLPGPVEKAGTALIESTATASTEVMALGETGLIAGEGMAAAGAGATAASAAFPPLAIALLAAPLIIEAFTAAFGPAIEGFKEFHKALSNAASRTQTQNTKNLDLWKTRITEDVKSATTAAFDVIKESAQSALDAWDAVSGTIAATQGYTKEGVQDLFGTYAERLRANGLDLYVSSADIMKNLESVLQQGLYGEAAEEFAWMATVLNKAVPNQDFFQYASSYASIAANAMKSGLSQKEALQVANDELEAFASNLLYASREISGGFSTSLQNGSQLFADAAKIALSSQLQSADVSDISGVLTSVSAIVSATAPDLADSIVSAVVDAATGGNSSTITALRSMAGTGASNTAFLQALAKDPQKVFSTLFSNLSQLQNMSSSNYMEVAEGLSEVFGMSMEAFTRVDFAYLADAINAMSLTNNALSQNMELMKAGQTTSTAEQLRMQKINEYMIEEGLAYVLDSEVGRAVQEHMWEEQLMREIEENTFAVDLQGGALEFLQGIFQTVENIINFLNPLSWLKGIGNVVFTALEAAEINQDIVDIVTSGVVGSANQKALSTLFPTGPTDYREQGLLDLDYHRWVTGETSNTEELRQGAFSFWKGITGQVALNDLTSALTGAISKSGLADQDSKNKRSNAYYQTKLVSKSAAGAYTYSGDWRDNYNYNAIYQPEQQKTRVLKMKVGDRLVDDTGTQKGATAAQKEAHAMAIQSALSESMSDYLATADKSKDLTAKFMKTDIQLQKEYADLAKYARIEDITTKSKTGDKTFMTQQEIEKELAKTSADIASKNLEPSFEQWAKEVYGMSVQELSEALLNYGTDINTIMAKFDEMQSKEASKQQKARDLHEVQFWEDMQRFATDLFPEYLNEWKKYYILNTAYTDATRVAYDEAMRAAEANKTKTEDAVLELASHLTGDDIWQGLAKEIANPTVQTNMLLSQILLYVHAIMQQNNETSIVSVPTALSSLGLGLTTTGTSTSDKTT